MSYCRFHNTYLDLMDCSEGFDEITSEEEKRYAIRLVELCSEIVDMYEDEDLDEAIEIQEEE